MKKLVILVLLAFSLACLAEDKPELKVWGEDGPQYTVMGGCALFAFPTVEAASMSFYISDRVQLISGPHKDLFDKQKTWYKFKVIELPAPQRLRDSYAFLTKPVCLTEGFMFLDAIESRLRHDGSYAVLSPFRHLTYNIWSEFVATEVFNGRDFDGPVTVQTDDIYVLDYIPFPDADEVSLRVIHGSLNLSRYGFTHSIYVDHNDFKGKMQENLPDYQPQYALVPGAWYRATDNDAGIGKLWTNFVYEYTGKEEIRKNKPEQDPESDDEKLTETMKRLRRLANELTKYAWDEECFYEFVLIGEQNCASGAINTAVHLKEKRILIKENDCLPDKLKRISKDVPVIRDEDGPYIDEEGRLTIRVPLEKPEKKK